MIIPDYKVGTQFEINCTKYMHPTYNVVVYRDFDISHKLAFMYGRKPEDIIKVNATIIEEDVLVSELIKYGSTYDSKKIDYVGYVDFDNDDGVLKIHMIYSNVSLYNMCFPYGPDACRFYSNDIIDSNTGNIKHHKGDRKGMTVRLKIEDSSECL
jgi:hypothetical protein